jgi:hypothetical protein
MAKKKKKNTQQRLVGDDGGSRSTDGHGGAASQTSTNDIIDSSINVKQPALPPQDNDIIDNDLSSRRQDEMTVLSAIYGEDDFTSTIGAWQCPLYRIRVRSPDNNNNNHHRCSMTLCMQLDSKYPKSVPLLRITDVEGDALLQTSSSSMYMSELLTALQSKSKECAMSGEVMGFELGRIVEDFIIESIERREMENKRRLEDMKGGKKVRVTCAWPLGVGFGLGVRVKDGIRVRV